MTRGAASVRGRGDGEGSAVALPGKGHHCRLTSHITVPVWASLRLHVVILTLSLAKGKDPRLLFGLQKLANFPLADDTPATLKSHDSRLPDALSS